MAVSPRREFLAFSAVLAAIVGGFFAESLFGGQILSPADVLFASGSFARRSRCRIIEPANRLLIDPVLQFQPWLEFNRSMIRSGRLPLWNPMAGCGAPHLANGQSAVFDPFHAIAYLGELPDALAWMAAARLWFAGLGMFLLARAWGFGPWGRWFSGLAFPFCGFLVVWLLFPVTNVAVWMPWVFLATERVWERPIGEAGRLARPGRSAGLCWAGTSRPAPMSCSRPGPTRAGEVGRSRADRRGLIGLVSGRRPWAWGSRRSRSSRSAFYLARSPVWGDRERERGSALDAGPAAGPRRGLHRPALPLREPAARPAQPGEGARASTT